MLTKSSVGNLPVRLGTFPPPGTSSWPGGTPGGLADQRPALLYFTGWGGLIMNRLCMR
jgi:hypothetical protein